MRALVTGGAGFIGASLVARLLAEQFDVEVIDDLSSGSMEALADVRADRTNNLKIHRHDLVEPSTADLVARIAPDLVFHLASASPSASAARTLEVAGVGTVHVLEGLASLASSVKVVVALDGRALHAGTAADDLPIRESAPHEPGGPSGASAATILAVLRAWRRSEQIEFTAIALADVYGPGDSRSVVARAVAATGEGALDLAGSDRRTFDFLHVDDAVDALARAATRGNGLVINAGWGAEVGLDELRASFAARGVSIDFRPDGRQVDPTRFSLDPGRASIHLGWTPFTSLDEGIGGLLSAPK